MEARLEEALKKAAAALRDADVPFLLAGSLAAWARGGPETQHDLDFVLRREDAERALEVLAEAGMRTEKPPEEWLYKAWEGDVLIDLIFQPRGLEVDDELLERGEPLHLLGITLPVMSIEDLMATKLLALREQELDYTPLIRIARAVREQVDWRYLRERTSGSPFAAAFFTLCEQLEIAPHEQAGAATVRLVEPGSFRPRVTG
jgi:predicted nucleotidyltransferase